MQIDIGYFSVGIPRILFPTKSAKCPVPSRNAVEITLHRVHECTEVSLRNEDCTEFSKLTIVHDSGAKPIDDPRINGIFLGHAARDGSACQGSHGCYIPIHRQCRIAYLPTSF